MARLSSSASLQDIDTKSKARARARVLQSLAGRIYFLSELAQGRVTVTSGRASTPPNPQGLIGIDHSGPPFGSCFLHPLFTMGGCQADVSGDAVGQREVGQFTSTSPLKIPIRLYVRPFAMQAGAPYSRGYLVFRARRATGSGNITVTIRFRRHGASGPAMSVASVVGSSTTSNFEPTAAWIDLAPGHNNVDVEFSSASTTAIIVECFSIHNREERSH
jgi:hypothetical protein